MKISPIDIRQHTFEKGFRGYDIDEVDAFMNSLSQEWERVASENKALKIQLETAEKDLARMKDIEKSLYLTLKTAEEASIKITSQASEEAEQRLNESIKKSDELINEAQLKATKMVGDAEAQSQLIKDEISNELRNQERDCKALEKYRDNLIVQLKSLVNNTGEIIDRFDKKFSKESIQLKMIELRKQLDSDEQVPAVDVNQVEIEFGEQEISEVVQVEEENPVQPEATVVEPEIPAVEEEEIVVEAVELSVETVEEEQKEQIIEEEEVIPEEIVPLVKKDIADETMEEIDRLKALRKEELVTNKEEEKVELPVKKTTGSFFDQIG